MGPLTFEAWLSRFIESGEAQRLYVRAALRDRQQRDRDRAKSDSVKPARRVCHPPRASQAPLSVAAVMARVPNSVFALGGMGDVSPMATGRGSVEG